MKKINPFQPFYILRGLTLQKTKRWLGPRITGPELRRRFKIYLERRLAPHFNCLPDNCTIFDRGTNPLVCRLTPHNGPPLVARCFIRQMGKEKSREHAEVSELLHAAGLVVPRLVFCDFSMQTLGRYGFDVVVEEWLEGRHPEPQEFTSPDSQLLKQAAQMMANLHRRTADKPGMPWMKRRLGVSFLEYFYVEREKRSMKMIEQCSYLEASPEDIARVRDFLDEHRKNFDSGPPYSLVHGDLIARNLVVRSNGQDENEAGAEETLALIDFGTVHYGLWPRDFIPFLIGCTGEDLETIGHMLSIYAAERPEASLDYFRRAWPYLYTGHYVEKTAAAIRKHQRTLDGRRTSPTPDFFRERAIAYWRLTREAMNSPLPI